MATPLVSVIIPTHNRRQLTLRAVESATRQELRDFEIIVVDDGSTDGTAQALSAIPGCRVLRTNHVGPAGARNAAAAQAAGKFLAFLDSDDHWLANHLSSLVPLMDRQEVGLVFSPVRTLTLDGRPVDGHKDRRRCYSGQITDPLFRHVFIHTSNAICRTSLFRKVGGFDEALPVCEDYHLWLRLSLWCQAAHVSGATAIRCWHEQGLSRENHIRNCVVRAAMLERFYRTEGATSAVSAWTASLRLAKAFHQAGRALLRAGQRADALRFLTRSLAHQPMQLRCWLSYVRCWIEPTQSQAEVDVREILRRLAWTV